jgi:hypothetical protein
MTVFLAGLAATFVILAVALPLGGTVAYERATLALLLPHLAIGDAFHWRHFPRLAAQTQRLWLGLAAAGAAVFLMIRAAGDLALPLFFTYFFGHFVKDLDFSLGAVRAGQGGATRWPKRVCASAAWLGYLVVSSGIIRDARLVTAGEAVAVATAGAFGLVAVLAGALGKVASAAAMLWRRYAAFAAGALLLCVWLDVFHPSNRLLPFSIVLAHFMQWYAFYWLRVRRTSPAPAAARVGRLFLAANALSLAAAWLYATTPGFGWLRYVYEFPYLAGGWTVMHVTWDWVPMQVRGIRVALF